LFRRPHGEELTFFVQKLVFSKSLYSVALLLVEAMDRGLWKRKEMTDYDHELHHTMTNKRGCVKRAWKKVRRFIVKIPPAVQVDKHINSISSSSSGSESDDGGADYIRVQEKVEKKFNSKICKEIQGQGVSKAYAAPNSPGAVRPKAVFVLKDTSKSKRGDRPPAANTSRKPQPLLPLDDLCAKSSHKNIRCVHSKVALGLCGVGLCAEYGRLEAKAHTNCHHPLPLPPCGGISKGVVHSCKGLWADRSACPAQETLGRSYADTPPFICIDKVVVRRDIDTDTDTDNVLDLVKKDRQTLRAYLKTEHSKDVEFLQLAAKWEQLAVKSRVREILKLNLPASIFDCCEQSHTCHCDRTAVKDLLFTVCQKKSLKIAMSKFFVKRNKTYILQTSQNVEGFASRALPSGGKVYVK